MGLPIIAHHWSRLSSRSFWTNGTNNTLNGYGRKGVQQITIPFCKLTLMQDGQSKQTKGWTNRQIERDRQMTDRQTDWLTEIRWTDRRMDRIGKTSRARLTDGHTNKCHKMIHEFTHIFSRWPCPPCLSSLSLWALWAGGALKIQCKCDTSLHGTVTTLFIVTNWLTIGPISPFSPGRPCGWDTQNMTLYHY